MPLSSASRRHIWSVILLVAGPFGGAAEVLLGGVRIRNTFDLRKRILAAGVFVDFHGIDPHFSARVVPLIPWIGTVKEVS